MGSEREMDVIAVISSCDVHWGWCPLVSSHELVVVVTLGYQLVVIVRMGYQEAKNKWKDCLLTGDGSLEYMVGRDVRMVYQLVGTSYYLIHREGVSCSSLSSKSFQ